MVDGVHGGRGGKGLSCKLGVEGVLGVIGVLGSGGVLGAGGILVMVDDRRVSFGFVYCSLSGAVSCETGFAGRGGGIISDRVPEEAIRVEKWGIKGLDMGICRSTNWSRVSSEE